MKSSTNKLIVVAGLCAQAGKSTMAKHLLQPSLPGSIIIAIDETTNQGQQIEELIAGIAGGASVIADISSSVLAAEMQAFEHIFRNLTDAFVVPVLASYSSMDYALTTIDRLCTLSQVPPNKIFVVPNQVAILASEIDIEKSFGDFADKVRAAGAHFVASAAVWKSGTYSTISGNFAGETIQGIGADQTDFRTAIFSKDSSEEAKRALLLRSLVVVSAKQ